MVARSHKRIWEPAGRPVKAHEKLFRSTTTGPGPARMCLSRKDTVYPVPHNWFSSPVRERADNEFDSYSRLSKMNHFSCQLFREKQISAPRRHFESRARACECLTTGNLAFYFWDLQNVTLLGRAGRSLKSRRNESRRVVGHGAELRTHIRA